ncbi:MAG TPA: hypothetical protein VKB76_01100, partial [Ktedonobacterales bacterium]|nr:hypothetical protein [Ktedonobacterales bacterium]
MPNYFQLNLVLYGDRAGLGAYEVGHFLQHQQYAAILASRGVILPDYDILHMQSVNENAFVWWLNQHQTIHELLAQQSNVSGVDLSFLDPQSPEMWEWWQGAHRAHHAGFDH